MAGDADMVEEHEVHDRASPGRKRKVAKCVAIVLGGLALLVGALLLGLNTGVGKRVIANQIADFELENGISLSVGRIEGSIYGDMVLHDVALNDLEGVFLTSPEVHLDWSPFAFASNHIDIDTLTAERATLLRLPELRPTDPDDPILPDYDIDVDEFRIDRFVVEEAITGTPRVLSLAGSTNIADGRALAKLDAVTLGDVGGDRIALNLDAVPEANRLDIDLAVDAPQDGVIAALAGLTQPMTMRLTGDGDWKSWDGQLEAELAESELADLAIAARDGTVTLRGPTRVARMFNGATASLLGPVMQVDMQAELGDRAALLSGNLFSDALRVNANGNVDLSDNSFDDLKLAFTLLRPSALAENLRGSGLRGNMTLNGDFATPRVEYLINANRVVLDEMGLENLTARGAATVDAEQIMIPLDARVSRIVGLDTVAGGSLRDVRLSGDLAIDGPRILSDNMRLRSDRIDAGLVLVADTERGFYTGAIDGRIDDFRVESVGLFNVRTDFDLQTERGGFALAGRVQARSTQLFQDSVRNFLGGNAVGASNVRYGSDGVIRFADLSLRSPLVRINGGSGFYAPDGRLALNADGVSEAYGEIGVRVAGTLTDPQATITAQRPDLGIGLANLEAEITGAENGYRLNATGTTDFGPLTADVILGTGEVTTLDIASANLAGIDFTGSLRQTPAGPFAGRLDAQGQGVTGIVRLDGVEGVQQALINLRARGTVLPGPAEFAVGSAIIDARVVMYERPLVVADAQVSQARIWGVDINAARAKIDYRDGSGTAQMLFEGVSGAPFRLAANAQLRPEVWRVALKGRVRGNQFETSAPARIIPKDGEYELLPTKLDFTRGSVRLAGTYGEGLKIQSRLDSLDMAMIDAFVPGLGVNGRASGSLDFSQPNVSAFPDADARLQIKGFRRTTATSISQPVDINFVGALEPDGGEARAVFRRRGSVIGRMVASLKPLPPGAGPWTTRLLSAPLEGGIRYNGPAGTLFSFAGRSDQRLSGNIGVAADFSGRVQRPQLAGIVRGEELVYENQTYGTRLSDMALAGSFGGDRFEIERLTATAGEGTVSASGYLSLSEASGYPMDVQLELDNARLARSDALAARATGSLQLTKAVGENALLTGSVVLPETRYQLIRQGAAQVPELSGVRFAPPKGPQRVTGDEIAEKLPGLFDDLRYDVAINASERLYVTGMGLESEWQADLRLLGTAAEPRLAGDVQLVRGTLGFAERSFELRRGRVGFTGGREINPTIALTASEDIEDITVNVNVTGRAYDPQIAFTSVPGLPQDEIMSRILFGSSIGNLSTIQAVQLAASLNTLRGSGGGLNPMGKIRSATGIDRLRILGADEATGRGTALAAGQYLTDDIYVEFITDARGFTATQLEVSLTPFLSVLSQAGGSGATNVSVRYRKNY